MIKVSVIVPVYNVEKYLERCLNSLVSQTYKDYEVICINDCSPDRCGDILDKFQKKYSSIIRILEKNQNIGLGRSRERGIRHAEGEYIMFVDSDDYVKNDYVQTYVKEIEDHPCDIVIGGFIKDRKGKLKIHKMSHSVWSNTTYSIACAKMFRKEFILSNGVEFTSIRCAEDIYFSLVMFYYNATYSVMNYAGYYYYYNEKSITGSMNHTNNTERFISDIFTEFLTHYDIKKIAEERQRVIEYTYLANMINALITYGHGAGLKRMNEKYQYIIKDINKKFPDYRNNPYVGIFRPKGQIRKIRYGVGITMYLHKIHLDKLLFYIISLF